MTPSEAPDQTSAPKQQGENSNPPEYKLNCKVIVPVVLISAVVLLVCLPVCALLIVNSTGCCLNGPENVVTFWASMMAGFLALFGMLVTGVFVITSLRVEATARAQAQIAARDEVWTYIRNYRKKLSDDLCALESLVGELKKRGERAMQALTEAQEDVETRQEEAGRAIAAARNEMTAAAHQAQDAVAKALDETTNAATEAQEAIGKAMQEVQSRRDGAIRAIDNARQEAEAAAKPEQEPADRATGGPTQREGGPEQSDE